jgi:hypothetical protein
MNWAYRRIATVAATVMLLIAVTGATEQDQSKVSPVFGVRLPAGYRQWQVISVAHEAGNLNDIRVILGNELAIRAYRGGQRPFPDGTILARIAWKMVPSPRNNAVFGRSQSFVAGDATNVQIELKDAKKYASSGGWGYGQFENDRANTDGRLIRTCYACHSKLMAHDDFIFTHYAR